MAFVINVIRLLNGSCGQWRLFIKRNLLFRPVAKHLSTRPANTTLTKCWSTAGPPSATMVQHQNSTGPTPRVCWAALSAGLVLLINTAGNDYKPTPTQCLSNVRPASPVLASMHSVQVTASFCGYLRADGTVTML